MESERPTHGRVGTGRTGETSVFAGGQFQNVSGQAAYGLAKISRTATGTGALDTTWHPSVRNAGEDPGIYSLVVQNNHVYGTAWHFGPGGNLEGVFKSPIDGSTDPTDVLWVTDCHGDLYSSFLTNGVVYTAGHAHYCGNMGGGHPQYRTGVPARAGLERHHHRRDPERRPRLPELAPG